MSNNLPFSNIPQALENHRSAIKTHEKMLDYMQKVNDHYFKHGTCKGAPGMSDSEANIIDRRIMQAQGTPDAVPFPDYDFVHLRNTIENMKKTIKRLLGDC